MKWALLALCPLLAGASAHAGLLDALHVRAKADAPLEADQPGYGVVLMDTHSDALLVSGSVSVPDAFGKVDAAILDITDSGGQRVGTVTLAPGNLPGRKASFDFNLRQDCLKNSTLTFSHFTPDAMDVATVHLGTFGVRDFRPEKPWPVPRASFAIAEQGIYGEREENFTATDTVAYEEGCHFGLRLLLRGDGRSLPLRVEQTLPAPPKTWGDAETTAHLTISADGRTSSQTQTVATNELLQPGWTLAEGDPEGDYQVKVFVRDELMKTFVFHVRRAANPASGPTP